MTRTSDKLQKLLSRYQDEARLSKLHYEVLDTLLSVELDKNLTAIGIKPETPKDGDSSLILSSADRNSYCRILETLQRQLNKQKNILTKIRKILA